MGSRGIGTLWAPFHRISNTRRYLALDTLAACGDKPVDNHEIGAVRQPNMGGVPAPTR